MDISIEWTLAETCPIFKRDDEFDEFKFRTVSILVYRDMCKNSLFTTSIRIYLNFFSTWKKLQL